MYTYSCFPSSLTTTVCTSNTTQKYVFGHYTSLIDSKNYLEISLNAQYDFSLILYSAKNMVLLSCRTRRRKPCFHHGQKYWIVPRIGPTGLYGFIAGFGLLKRNRSIPIDPSICMRLWDVFEVHIYFILMEFSSKMTMPVWPISGIFNR
jgi:hypothetical protein